MYLGSRRLLPLDSPLRQSKCGEFQFIDEERLGPPPTRTTALMHDCLQIAKDEGYGHMCGFAGPAMFSKRIDFDFKLDNIPDCMHNLGRVFTMIMDILLGGLGNPYRAKEWTGKDAQHRAECELFGIHPSVWTQAVKLEDDVRAALLQPDDEDINTALRAVLERFVRAVGVNPTNILVPELRAMVIELRTKLRRPGDYFYLPAKPAPLPWRLTPQALADVDRRIHNMVFPHNTDRLVKEGLCPLESHTLQFTLSIHTTGLSFLLSNKPTSKTAQKLMALLVVLPTALRHYVRNLRRGLSLLTLGLRMLEGQAHSFNECIRLGVEPGSRCLDKRNLRKIRLVVMSTHTLLTCIPHNNFCTHSQTIYFGRACDD